jgi:hypothetical protein
MAPTTVASFTQDKLQASKQTKQTNKQTKQVYNEWNKVWFSHTLQYNLTEALIT